MGPVVTEEQYEIEEGEKTGSGSLGAGSRLFLNTYTPCRRSVNPFGVLLFVAAFGDSAAGGQLVMSATSLYLYSASRLCKCAQTSERYLATWPPGSSRLQPARRAWPVEDRKLTLQLVQLRVQAHRDPSRLSWLVDQFLCAGHIVHAPNKRSVR